MDWRNNQQPHMRARAFEREVRWMPMEEVSTSLDMRTLLMALPAGLMLWGAIVLLYVVLP